MESVFPLKLLNTGGVWRKIMINMQQNARIFFITAVAN